VRLTDPAVEDLRRLLKHDPQIVRWALKKMLLLERDPEAGRELLGALIGWRKLTVADRDWRVVWRVTYDDAGAVIVDVAEVWAVGARSDKEVYREMEQRVAGLPDSPQTQALAEVVSRFGKVAAGIQAAHEPAPEPALPDWLRDRLTNQVGLMPDRVDELSLEEAVDLWSAWVSSPRP